VSPPFEPPSHVPSPSGFREGHGPSSYPSLRNGSTWRYLQRLRLFGRPSQFGLLRWESQSGISRQRPALVPVNDLPAKTGGLGDQVEIVETVKTEDRL
jgi:hypothetical protein